MRKGAGGEGKGRTFRRKLQISVESCSQGNIRGREEGEGSVQLWQWVEGEEEKN